MSPLARQAGMSLPELLVATAVFSIASVGALAVCLRASTHYRAASHAQRLQERAQYVFATLEPEVQMAGFAGIGSALTPLPPELAQPLVHCGSAWALRADVGVEVTSRYVLDCPPYSGGAVSGSGTLTVRRLSARRADPEPGRLQWQARRAPDQGNWVGAAVAPATAPAAELRNLLVRHYYVARQADGDTALPALRVKTLSAISGVPAWIDTEVMPGVAALHAETDPAAGPPRSLRVTLTLQAEPGSPGAAQSRQAFTRHYAVRNVPATP